ncbi:MAG: antibiotic biosynthesis monooxygenase family protein [Acidimicrobiales bacterium]
MTVVKINAITVRQGSGDELARRFAQRAGAVDHAEGFEGFELMKPDDDRDTWLVITRWRDDESFDAWVSSPAFAHGHRGPAERSVEHAGGSGHGGPPDDSSEDPSPPPVGVHSELWSYIPVSLPAPE